MYMFHIENIQSLEGIYKVVHTPTFQMDKVELWTCGFTIRTCACGVMWCFNGALGTCD